MDKYLNELTVVYKNKNTPNSAKYYLIKLIISRSVCTDYHYLDRGDRVQIWFSNLANADVLSEFINGQGLCYEWNIIQRSHILELIRPACKFVLEDLGTYIEDYYQIGYLIHTILTSVFMGWDRQKDFFKYMVKLSDENIKHYNKCKGGTNG